ncbi:MAG: methyltransferase domain-containing protein [Mycobacteriales bacterium]
MPKIANGDMAAGWDGPEGDHWAEHAEHYAAASQRHRDRLLAVVPIDKAASVVDIGCGTGSSTRDVARIASSGSALGLDLSSSMLKLARHLAEAEGLGNVHFEQADVQVHPFEAGRFDLAISAFGAMFFADPWAAFANVSQAMRPGGELALLSWRELGRNEWLTALRGALAVGRQLPEPPSDLPGPFGLAGADHVSGVLSSAGFVDIHFEEVDEPIQFGVDADDAFAFMKTLGMTTGLTQALAADDRSRALDALQRTIVEHDTGAGVLFGSSAWLIRASI